MSVQPLVETLHREWLIRLLLLRSCSRQVFSHCSSGTALMFGSYILMNDGPASSATDNGKLCSIIEFVNCVSARTGCESFPLKYCVSIFRTEAVLPVRKYELRDLSVTTSYRGNASHSCSIPALPWLLIITESIKLSTNKLILGISAFQFPSSHIYLNKDLPGRS